jgi:hypothetical protein
MRKASAVRVTGDATDAMGTADVTGAAGATGAADSNEVVVMLEGAVA